MLPTQRTQAEVTNDTWNSYCEEIGEKYCICPELLEAMIEVESKGDVNAMGKDGDTGLMQIIPKYHQKEMKELCVTDLKNPYQNIEIGAMYIQGLFERYGDLPLVLMKYNGARDAEQRNNNGNFTDYANKIMKLSEQLEREHGK